MHDPGPHSEHERKNFGTSSVCLNVSTARKCIGLQFTLPWWSVNPQLIQEGEIIRKNPFRKSA